MFSKNFMTCSDYYTGTFFSGQLFSKHRSLDTYLTHGTIIRARIVVACLTVNYFFDELDQQVFQYFKLLQQSFTGVQPYRCSKKFTQSLQENAFAKMHFHKNAETLIKKGHQRRCLAEYGQNLIHVYKNETVFAKSSKF